MRNSPERVRNFIIGRPQFRGLLESAAWLALPAAATSLLDSWGWPWELPAHFRVQFSLALVAGAVIWLIFRHWIRAAVFLLAALVMWCLCGAPLPIPDTRTSEREERTFRICSFNVHTANRDFAATINFLRTNRFDAVFLMEIDGGWLSALEELRQEYPFFLARPRSDNFGVALLSRHAPRRQEIVTIGAAGVPSVDVDLGRIRLFGTHPLPPGSREMATLRNEQLLHVAARLKAASRTVLVGDLNCTPWSSPFRQFENESGLRDTSGHFSWQPTWPSPLPSMFRIPIDHALVSTDIVCITRSVGPDLGSDHRPLLVEIASAER